MIETFGLILIIFWCLSFLLWNHSNKKQEQILQELKGLRKDLQEDKIKYRVH